MSTLAEGPRGLNHLLNHQGYPTNGVHHPAHPLSHHQTQTQQTDSPLSSAAATSDAHHGRYLPQPEGRQLRSSRRQEKAPDWGSFYKNGVPRATEIIVIDDSPEPPAAPPHAQVRVNGHNHALPEIPGAGSSSRKRKYEDTASQASYRDGQYVNGSSHQHSASGSYQDRATLPAGPASTSTDDSSARAGPKRKRVTKAQPANGVGLKRQDTRVLRGDQADYRGLGKKATKASAVSVRAVHVS